MKTKFSRFLTLLLMLIAQLSFAQEKEISGVVSDETGPLPGVTIIKKGTSKGVETDFDGNYSIKVKTGDVLVFSFVGMKTEFKTVGDSSSINLTMLADDNLLDEVIVVAFGKSTKEAFTGSASVIKSEVLETRSLTSPIAAIEGSTSGVQFIAASGQPGSSPEIVIRGVGTLNGDTDPLFIVDGVAFQGALNALSQDDIESMTVLKDAASTALYGSRAANGVVIITTKSGSKSGGVKVNITSQFSTITKSIDEYDAVNPGEYYELMWQSYKNALGGGDTAAIEASSSIYNRLGRNPFNVANDQIVGVDGKLNPNAQLIAKDLDWYNALERVGTRRSNSINLSTGGEDHSLYFSVSDLDEEGYVIESSYERTTARLNGSFDVNDWLSVDGSTYFTGSTTTGSTSRDNSIANVFAFAKDVGSIYSPYLLDPVTGDYTYDETGGIRWDRGESDAALGILARPTNVGRNALEESILNEQVTKANNYGFRFNPKFTIMDGLTLNILYGQDIQGSVEKDYENAEVGDGAPTARLQDNRFRRTVENFNQLINYKKTLGSHNFDVTVGHESFDRNFSSNATFKTTETINGIYELDNFATVVSADGSSTDYTLEGYLGNLTYNYDNRFYFSSSIRRDGSSVFTNNKWGTFYSFGGSWRISQENFMENVSFINNLKLRASYGEVGNDQLGNFYISQPLYSINSNAGEPALIWDTTGNADLKWETSASYDVALEFGLFNNRLTGAFEYYKKNSTDILYNLPIPASEGQTVAPNNVGDLYNEGFEISLDGQIIKSDNFSWNLGLQASTFKNEITSLPAPFITDENQRWEEGRSRYDYYVYDYAGVDPSNGDALFYMYEEVEGQVGVPILNANGTKATTNDWSEAGRTYVGKSAIPDIVGSVSNRFKYKNFDLNFLLTYQIGGYAMDFGYANMMHEGDYGASLHPDALKAWRAPGDITDVPRLENGNTDLSPRVSSRWLTDASFLAFKTATLAYNLDKDLIQKIGIDNLKLYLSADNIYTFTKRNGLNPQYDLTGETEGDDFNPSRTLSVGVNIAF